MTKGVLIDTKEGKRVVKGLGYYETPEIENLKQLVKISTEKHGDAIAFRFKDKNGNITGKTYNEFDRDIDCLGTALISLRLKGMNYSIIGENRYEWGVCYLAVTNGSGIAVPLDKYLPENEVETLVQRGKVDVIFYSPSFHDMMVSISNKNKRLKYFICMEKLENMPCDSRFQNLPELISKGNKLLNSGDKSFVNEKIDNTEMSVLLFTSGTTSISKGVMLSHKNIVSNVVSICATLKAGPGDVHLSLLPLHHTFENTVGFLFMVYAGVCIAYCDGIKHIAQNLKEYNISLLVAVPAVFETFYKRLTEGIKKSGKEKLVESLIKVSGFLRSIGIDLRRKLFKSIFDQFAPKLRLAVSGAAPLDPEMVVWFDNIGFRLLQGYGLTEASPVVASNNDFVNEPGTIGYPIKDVEVAILDPDESGMGELITRGSNVMLGYYEDPDATSQALIPGGWLRTGDLATIDNNGFIRITGRAKSMIVFTNGKKAFPEEYEILLANIPCVKDSFVWGNKAPDGDIQVCAKIVIDRDALSVGGDFSEKETSEILEAAIKEINKGLPQYKIIRHFVFSFKDLIKTTTMKTKRNVELERVLTAVRNSGIDMRRLNGKFIDIFEV
jgi:long-chain acyl-CoA synthetase